MNRRSFLLALAGAPLAAQEQLDFLRELSQHQGLADEFPSLLKEVAHQRLEQRRRDVSAMRTPADVAERKAYVRKTIEEAVGGFPEKTPLNAQVTGTIEKDGYKIEKIVFESRPDFHVTANLYIPTRGRGPYPAVLYPLGHEQGGKSHDAWQRMLANLARQGYAALAWDPVGQGERAQIYDPDLQGRKLIRSTTEHTVLGVQCLLAGDNIARYTIWDGIRALDYLLSRPEVDATRVACTGNSGGGTHTSYISALEDRIHVAAPSCFLTGWGRLLETIGPQDAEQVLLPWIGAGLDHADFVVAFAPRPFLMLAAVRDFFSIVGARSVFAEAKGVYRLFDAEDKLAMAEVDEGHGYHQPNRIRAYQWFARHLKQETYDGGEQQTEVLEFEDLACTPTGQVASSLGGETVHSLNRQRIAGFRPSTENLLDKVKRRTAFRAPSKPPASEAYGVIQRSGYRIEKLLLRPEPQVPLPALLFLPDSAQDIPAVIHVSGGGKSETSAPGGDVEWLVQQGAAVLSLDLRGFGETSRLDPRNGSDFPRYFGDYNSAMTSFLLGRSMVGMRAADILSAVFYLALRNEVDANNISLVGRGRAAVPALHAALFDSRIKRVALEEMLVSYRAVVDRRIHRDVLENIAVGALRDYDLPDLVAAIAPRPVRIINPVDPLGKRLWPQAAQRAYASAGSAQVLRRKTNAGPSAVYADFV